jgi:hypothetical protein
MEDGRMEDGGMEGWRMEGWRDGRMEDGRMEEWKNGGMEGWRNGGMEGCRLTTLKDYSLSVESGRGYNLDLSLFERLRILDFPARVLFEQRRMRPIISSLIRDTLYPELADSPHVMTYPEVRGVPKNLFFFDHVFPEDLKSTSKKNEKEADLVVAFVRHMLLQGYKGDDLTVITPYLGQLWLLQKKLESAEISLVLDERDEIALEDQKEKEEQGGVGSKKKKDAEILTSHMKRMMRLVTIDKYVLAPPPSLCPPLRPLPPSSSAAPALCSPPSDTLHRPPPPFSPPPSALCPMRPSALYPSQLPSSLHH